MKSVQIRSFSGPYFPTFGLNMDILRKSTYSVRMQENTDQKKIRIWTFFTECWIHLADKNSQPGAKINSIFRLPQKCLNRIIIKPFKNIWFSMSIKIMLCYLKFRFKQQLCREEHQYATSSFVL